MRCCYLQQRIALPGGFLHITERCGAEAGEMDLDAAIPERNGDRNTADDIVTAACAGDQYGASGHKLVVGDVLEH